SFLFGNRRGGFAGLFRSHLQSEIRQCVANILELISDFLLPGVELCELFPCRLKILIHPVLPRADLEIVETFFLVLAFSASVRSYWTWPRSGPEEQPEKKQNHTGADCPGKPCFRFQLFQNRHG